ncbi:MAG: hypothetical protein HQ477_00325 [Chloroflexi bacterium]|nr:hypothetical protein [Chloroflexota bacterium]
MFEKDRTRVTVWVDNNPSVEFGGTDDHDNTGDVIAQLEVSPNDGGQLIDLSYPLEPVPERFLMFSPVGYKTRVSGARTPNCWGVVANISDHRKLAAYAAMKNLERIWRDDARRDQ